MPGRTKANSAARPALRAHLDDLPAGASHKAVNCENV
jgi:hypothetical protein